MQYTPLDRSKKEIRLIKLHPRPTNASTAKDFTPRCDLIQVSLNDKPEYVALSYVWGDLRDTKIITVGESSVPVTRYLYSALEHLRYDTEVRIIWIDALCINQRDNDEKSWQVQLMRDIYQRALFVTIWLGPTEGTSNEVMEFLCRLGTRAMRFGLDGGRDIRSKVTEQWRILASQPPPLRDEMVMSSQEVAIEHENWTMPKTLFTMGDLKKFYYDLGGYGREDCLFPVEGMVKLFERPWWSRTWVLQEITLAQKAGFVCGTKRLSRSRCTAALNTFKILAGVLQERILLEGAELTDYQKKVAGACFDWPATIQLSMWDTQRYCPFPLLALLRATCIAAIRPRIINQTGLEASDPRDKIYGLLGLAADRDQLEEFGVRPDYSKSCLEVYISVTMSMLKQGHICLLSLNFFPKNLTGLPSWVPDWSQPLNDPLQGIDTDHMTLKPEYKVSRTLLPKPPIFKQVRDTTRVSISGFIYDEIHDIGASWAELCLAQYGKSEPFHLAVASKLLLELVRLSILRGGVYRTLKECIRGTARTAIAEIGYNETRAWARIGNRRYSAALSLLMLQTNGNTVETAKFCGEIYSKSHGRRPFVTKKGHLGLGFDHVEPGDVVAVLIGCQVPFVLRRSAGESYRVVGETYVDGIMDGEAVVGRESDHIGFLELI